MSLGPQIPVIGRRTARRFKPHKAVAETNLAALDAGEDMRLFRGREVQQIPRPRFDGVILLPPGELARRDVVEQLALGLV
jgi:hypothetical protein